MNRARHALASLALLALLALVALLALATSARADAPAGGVELVSPDLKLFKPYNNAGNANFQSEVVAAPGEPFADALRLTTLRPGVNGWDFGVTSKNVAPIRKGDVLWATFRARRVTTMRESGEAQCEVALLQHVDGKEVRPLERVVSFGSRWTEFAIPFVAGADNAAGDASLAVRFAYGIQGLEVGGLRVVNYGPDVDVTSLPRTRIRYDGFAPDAAWRKAADERIERIRKGDLTVHVVDANGKPVGGATVAVRMRRHAFAWGTAIQTERVVDRSNPENERYRQALLKYFNKVVFENDMKWGRWLQPAARARVLAAIPWLEEHRLSIRGHVIVWPSWRQTPKAVFTDDVKKDPAAIRKLVADHIAEQARAVGAHLDEWDVENETYQHHDLLDVAGRGLLVDWFKQARAAAPNAKLFYNDYTMFQAGPGQDYFYRVIKELKDGGAPVDAVGEQGHIGSSPPGIPFVLATLDKFGALGLPIQISEFDIDSDDPGLQADYMRDFTTAMFSHPSVVGVVQWGFWARAHWIPRSALFDDDWTLRPHGKAWVELTTKTWWTNADGNTDADGRFATRGFYGDYEATVTRDGRTKTQAFTLAPGGANTIDVTLP